MAATSLRASSYYPYISESDRVFRSRASSTQVRIQPRISRGQGKERVGEALLIFRRWLKPSMHPWPTRFHEPSTGVATAAANPEGGSGHIDPPPIGDNNNSRIWFSCSPFHPLSDVTKTGFEK